MEEEKKEVAINEEKEKTIIPPKDKKDNTTIIIIALIIIGLLITGVGLYFILTSNSEADNIDPNTIESNGTENTVIYKNIDGSKVLKLINKIDQETLAKIKKIDRDFDEKSLKYLAEYKGKLIAIDQIETYEKYTEYSGDVIGGTASQCGTSHFVVNTENKELLNFDYGEEGFNIYKMGDKFYFSENYCSLNLTDKGFYDENLNRIGDYYFGRDASNNFYVFYNNNFIKYNKDGKIIKENKTKYDIKKVMGLEDSEYYYIYGDSMYVIYDNDILDTMTNEKYPLKVPANYRLDMVTYNDQTSILEITYYIGDDEETGISRNTVYKFNFKNKKLEKSKDPSIPSNAVAYNDGNGKYIYLLEIANEKGNTLLNSHTYELYEDDTKIKVYSNYENNKFIVYNDNNWYLLDKTNKKIIAFYTSKNKINYSINGWSDDKQEWYIIYDKDKIVQIINENNGSILSFDKNNPDAYVIQDEKLYLQFNNKIVKYDASGKTLDTKTYNKIIHFSRTEYADLIILQNNAYYKVNLSSMEEEELSKKVTYRENNKNIDFYILQKGNENEGIDDLYMFEYDGKCYTTTFPDFDSSNEYDNISFDRIEGAAQNYVGSLLVDQKNKVVVAYCNYCAYSIEKVSNGYFFTSYEYQEGDSPYDYSTTNKVITSTGKTLKGKGFYAIQGNYYILEDNNDMVYYDIDGNVIKKITTNKIYIISDKRSFVKIDNKYYIINLENDKQIEIQPNDKFDINNSLIYRIKDNKIYFVKTKNNIVIDGEDYTYDYINNVVKKESYEY